jgi:hypothetical protein
LYKYYALNIQQYVLFLQELPTAGEMRHILLSKQFMSVSVDDLQTKYPLVGISATTTSKASKQALNRSHISTSIL